jgi:tetratricopeptide (TPR) repeat protein
LVDSKPLLSETSVDAQCIIEDVVTALTGEDGGEMTPPGGGYSDLRAQLERAAAEFDKRTADAFGRALLDSLTEDPGNLRQLEALIILGLAHPDVLERHRISLAVEGRRLAILLERAGEVERARSVLELLSGYMPGERTIDYELAGILRRSGNTDELVDRYLRRAERAVEDGNVSEAIPWLQEILLLDRTRRDVARMIRDLRYQAADRQTKRRRRNRMLAVVVLLSAVSTAVVGREVRIHRQYDDLPPIVKGELDTLYQRKQGLERLVANHHFWVGILSATAERDGLTQQIAECEREAARRTRAQEADARRRKEMAEGARNRGLRHSELGEFLLALTEFERALDLAGEAWESRAQVEADVAALRNWKAEGARAK